MPINDIKKEIIDFQRSQIPKGDPTNPNSDDSLFTSQNVVRLGLNPNENVKVTVKPTGENTVSNKQ
jgi:hypothetical protein